MTGIQKQLAQALEHALHVMNSTIRDKKNIADLRTAVEIGQAALAAHKASQDAPRHQEARGPLTEEGAAWTRVEDGLPLHGQLVLCELDDASAAGLGINFGFSVETWDEDHTLAGVVRWLPLNRLPESLEDQTVLDCIAAHGIKGE